MTYPIIQRELTIHLHNKTGTCVPLRMKRKSWVLSITAGTVSTCIPIALRSVRDFWRAVPSQVRGRTFTAIVDWAVHGGLGSRLRQRHNMVGIIFGGEWDDFDLRDSAEIDSYFIEHFGKKTSRPTWQ